FGRVLLVAHDEPHAAVRALHDLVRGALGLRLDLVPGPPDETIDLEQRASGVEYRLSLGHLSYQALVVLERHHGRSGPVALGVHQVGWLAALYDGDHAVRSAQIDAYGFCHVWRLL